MSVYDGGPAFPEIWTDVKGERGDYHTETYSAGGMSLRDYFAVQALPIVPEMGAHNMLDNEKRADYMARRAYEYATAMLKAREA